MTFRHTPIHRQLGIAPQDLTWELIEATLRQGLLEQTDLDWKREPYAKRGNCQDVDELVKDVAAMANSGGGVIVLGILENHETSGALRIHGNGVALSEPDQRSYRQRVASGTRPAVTGLDFLVVSGPSGTAVTLIEVQPSLDAPHLVFTDGAKFSAPFRDGPRTAYMAERQLEAAYRRRLSDRTSQLDRCRYLYEEAADNSHPSARLCFVAAAVPEAPRPSGLGRPSKGDAVQVFTKAKEMTSGLAGPFGGDHGLSPLNDVSITSDVFLNPRPGHERRVARSDREEGNPKHRSVCLSVHDDGSVSLAWTLGGMLSGSLGGPNETSAPLVESAIMDLVCLVSAASQHLGTAGGHLIRCGLEYRGEEPILLRRKDPMMNLDLDADYSTPVRRFLPAHQFLAAEHGANDLAEVAAYLALDCISQSGVFSLTHLATPTN